MPGPAGRFPASITRRIPSAGAGGLPHYFPVHEEPPFVFCARIGTVNRCGEIVARGLARVAELTGGTPVPLPAGSWVGLLAEPFEQVSIGQVERSGDVVVGDGGSGALEQGVGFKASA